MKRHLLTLLSAGFLFAGCTTEQPAKQQTGDRAQAGIGWNGIGWNGIGWNGIGWNGIGWNGIGWNGIGWNGIGWNGIGWNGVSFSNLSIDPALGLDAWVNAAANPTDREGRVKGIGYLIGCMCDSSVTIPWHGTNIFMGGAADDQYFPGNFGLAPTWCAGTGTVPDSEKEMVSACLLSRINIYGIHNAISLRGYETNLALGPNEKLIHAYPSEQYWGNLFDDATTSYQDPSNSLWYAYNRGNACHFPPHSGSGMAQMAADLQQLLGRTCAWDGCGGPVQTTYTCLDDGSVDGSQSEGFNDSLLTSSAGMTSDPAVGFSGLNNGYVNDYQDGLTGSENATFRGRTTRRISSFLGTWANLETGNWKDDSFYCDPNPGSSCTAACTCSDTYCGTEASGQAPHCITPDWCDHCAAIVRKPAVIGCGTDYKCPLPDECVHGQALASLAPGCLLPVDFIKPYDLLTNTLVSGSADIHSAITLRARYANGSGATQSIQILDQINGGPIDGSGFTPTASWDDFQNHDIYPYYPPTATWTPGSPGIRIAIAADPASPGGFPYLDYMMLYAGPPFGYQPRELWWDTSGGSQVINPKNPVCAWITVESSSQFTAAGDVRIRPNVSKVPVSQLRITLTHNGNKVAYSPSKDNSPWSDFISDFEQDNPKKGVWQICVTGPGGSLDPGSKLEMQKVDTAN